MQLITVKYFAAQSAPLFSKVPAPYYPKGIAPDNGFLAP